jgi:hypothetical protein
MASLGHWLGSVNMAFDGCVGYLMTYLHYKGSNDKILSKKPLVEQ